MSRLRSLLVVLIALLAASACASAVASAEPPELRSSSFPIKYEGTISEPATWEVPGGNQQFKCASGSTSEGEITGAKTVTAVMHFRGCRVTGVNSWCTSEGAKTGEIVTQPLEGTVVSAPNFAVAIVFKPKSGVNVVNTLKCLLVNSEVRGIIIAVCTNPQYKATSTLNLTLRQEAGYQTPEWYYTETEAKVPAWLETTWASGLFQRLGWNFNNTLSLSGGTVKPVGLL